MNGSYCSSQELSLSMLVVDAIRVNKMLSILSVFAINLWDICKSANIRIGSLKQIPTKTQKSESRKL